MTADLAILGAGGHGREVLEILEYAAQAGAKHRVLGFLDDDPELQGAEISGLPVLGPLAWVKDHPQVAVVLAVGTPRVTALVAEKLRKLGAKPASAVSPSALLSKRIRIGAGAVIFPDVIVNTDAVIGDFVTLNVAASVSHDSVVGDFSNINPGARLAGNVRVGRGCYIGMGANVIQGITIGDSAVIGAGAAVIDDIPAGVTAVGVPARPVRRKSEVR